MNNRKNKNSNNKGSITVFLTIILFTIVSFIFVLIDATRVFSARNQFVIASNNAAKSAMANYNAELFNEYGLFAYNSSDATEIAEEVFNKNINANYEDGAAGAGGILSLKGEASISQSDQLFGATDTFKKQMIYAMKYQGTENLAINVYERLVGLIEAAKQASISEDMAEIDEALGKLKKQLGGVENAKLAAQRSIIALVLASNSPKFSYLDKYTKEAHFDTYISNNELLKMVNECIGEMYFTGEFSKKDEKFVNSPIQNIYVYYYAQHIAKCYERGYTEEYEKAKEKYEKDIEKYNADLEKYNNDKKAYDKAMKDYEDAIKEYNENKDKEGFEGEKPKNPNLTEPKKPTEVEKPTILNDNLDDFKKIISVFCEKINSEINEILKTYFEKESQSMGQYIKLLDDGLSDVGDLISKEAERANILAMANELEARINEISLDAMVKQEVENYIANVKLVLKEETLYDIQTDLSNIKNIIKNQYMPNLWKNYGATNQNSDSVKQHIEGYISSSTDKIKFDDVDTLNFINGIKIKYSMGTFSSSNITEILKTYFDQSSNLVKKSNFNEFRTKIAGWHDGLKLRSNLTTESINKENLDIGERNTDDDNADKVGEKLEDEKENAKNSKALKKVLEALNSNEAITDIVFGGSGWSGVKAASELKELEGYSDAFESEDYSPSLLDKIYLTEYIMTNFKDLVDYDKYGTADNRTPKETSHESVLNYEIEAILNGKFDDQANKESMTAFVRSFRLACNTITIYKTKKMRTFTEKAANRICAVLSVGFSFLPWGGAAISAAIRSKAFRKITQAGLVLGWANMEASLDTSDIFRGFYVPLIKEGDEWVMKLGLELDGNKGDRDAPDDSVDNALNKINEDEKGESEPYNEQTSNISGKMSYGDILRARLLIKLLTNEEAIVNGTKELVNGNMNKVSGGFDYSTYYAAMKISVDSSVNTWFNNSSFSSGGRVNFKKFEYIKRYN